MFLLSWTFYNPFSLPGSIEQLRWFRARGGHHCCDLFHCVGLKITGLWIRKHKRADSVEKDAKHCTLLLCFILIVLTVHCLTTHKLHTNTMHYIFTFYSLTSTYVSALTRPSSGIYGWKYGAFRWYVICEHYCCVDYKHYTLRSVHNKLHTYALITTKIKKKL